MEPRRAGRDQDWTDAEAEGQPDLDTQPPGIDAQSAVEGRFPPRDHPVGVDELGVTEREDAIPETLAERAKRERPDVVQRPPEDPGGRLVEAEAGPGDRENEAIGSWDSDASGLSAEEAAVHIREP